MVYVLHLICASMLSFFSTSFQAIRLSIKFLHLPTPLLLFKLQTSQNRAPDSLTFNPKSRSHRNWIFHQKQHWRTETTPWDQVVPQIHTMARNNVHSLRLKRCSGSNATAHAVDELISSWSKRFDWDFLLATPSACNGVTQAVHIPKLY